MYKKNIFVLILFIFSLDATFSQTAHSHARQGDKKFIAKEEIHLPYFTPGQPLKK
jgi:hypothetical protein